MSNAQYHILEALADSEMVSVLTPSILAFNLGLSRQHVSRSLRELVDKGLVERVEKGKYRITESGRAEVTRE
jgi:predicted transcriptional regulator